MRGPRWSLTQKKGGTLFTEEKRRTGAKCGRTQRGRTSPPFVKITKSRANLKLRGGERGKPKTKDGLV